MSNFNVMIRTCDMKIGTSIAKAIRDRNGGLLGVQAMAFHHGQDQIEIACNVNIILFDQTNQRHVEAKSKGHTCA
jgi:glutamate formiminotransferase